MHAMRKPMGNQLLAVTSRRTRMTTCDQVTGDQLMAAGINDFSAFHPLLGDTPRYGGFNMFFQAFGNLFDELSFLENWGLFIITGIQKKNNHHIRISRFPVASFWDSGGVHIIKLLETPSVVSDDEKQPKPGTVRCANRANKPTWGSNTCCLLLMTEILHHLGWC